MDGKVGFYFKNLVTGETFGYNEKEQFLPASIVKVPLLAAMLLMREKGETQFSEKITITKDQMLPGCGVVQHMTGDENCSVTLDITTLYKFMIVISDTTATNALYKHYGNDKVIAALKELGLKGTQFNRAFYDSVRSQLELVKSLAVKTCDFSYEQGISRITHPISCIGRKLVGTVVPCHLIHVVGEVYGCIDPEIPYIQDTAVKRKFDTVVHDIGGIEILVRVPCRARNLGRYHHISAYTAVTFHYTGETIPEQTEIKRNLVVVRLLPAQIGIRGA